MDKTLCPLYRDCINVPAFVYKSTFLAKRKISQHFPPTHLFPPGPVGYVNVDDGRPDHLPPVVGQAGQQVLLVITEAVRIKVCQEMSVIQGTCFSYT